MNRTIRAGFAAVGGALLAFAPLVRAQEPSPAPPPAAKPGPAADPVAPLLARMRAAEQRCRWVQAELRTRGAEPGGLQFETSGRLDVLHGTHPARRTEVAYRYGDGLRGRVVTTETAAGLFYAEDSPATGELWLQFDPALVQDLAWAGTVLGRADLPGMADRQATAPFGSAVLQAWLRHFDLRPDPAATARGGEAGVWLRGARRPGLDPQDPDLPVADRAAAFVRERDGALLEATQHRGDALVVEVVVTAFASGDDAAGAPPAERFAVDAKDARWRPALQHLPMAEQVEQALQAAERQAAEAAKDDPAALRLARRPSARK